MIKVITIITNFIVITLMALLFGSCNQISNLGSITGSGNVITEKRQVSGDFKSVSVSNALNLVIEQSDKVEIIVEADDNLLKEIKTEVQNGVLVVSTKYGNFHNITAKKITVKMPVIEELEATSAATIDSGTLKGDKLSLESSSAGSIRVTAEYEAIRMEVSSASTQNISGKALQVEATTSSAGVINASELLANEVIASASSGSSITIHPIVSLKAEASSGGNIIYKERPKTTLQIEESSGGNVHQE